MPGLLPAIRSMTTLNRAAASAMVSCDVHAATDVTGFGLPGHPGNMLRASNAATGQKPGAHLAFDRIPVLPNVEACLAHGLCPAGTRRNLDDAAPDAVFDPARREAEQLLLADAPTSGGLTIAVAQNSFPQGCD
ncbi:MAG: AIR synthase-related protein [Alphaproteobacteria bacterium]|nr:AIR synthase-related protein [Alphaproteobacteria bacterium]